MTITFLIKYAFNVDNYYMCYSAYKVVIDN